MALHNPGNWHWVDVPALSSAEEWCEAELPNIEVEKDGVTAKVDSVSSVKGDCDVGQHKGKVITIFELKLILSFSGKAKDGSSSSGTITFHDISQDTEPNDFNIPDVEFKSELKEHEAIKTLARKELVTAIVKKMVSLRGYLINKLGSEIQHPPGEGPPSSAGYPKTQITSSTRLSSSTSESKSSKTTTTQTSSPGRVVNVTKLDVPTTEFRTTAAEAFQTFTDPQRIAAFTRSPPKVFEGAKINGKFEFFDGNVCGYFTKLDQPTEIEQQWRLNQWPAGHYSTLKLNFRQDEADHVTYMTVTWTGVPVGQEEVTLRNWNTYYIQSINQTFGFGTTL